MQLCMQQIRLVIKELARVHFPFASVPIHYSVAGSVPVRVTMDSTRIQQILANGLTNRCRAFLINDRLHMRIHKNGCACTEVCSQAQVHFERALLLSPPVTSTGSCKHCESGSIRLSVRVDQVQVRVCQWTIADSGVQLCSFKYMCTVHALS